MTDSPQAEPQELSPLKRAFLAIEELQAKVAAYEAREREPVAIVGIGCRFPGGVENPEGFVTLLRDGVDAVCETPPDARASYRCLRDDVPPPHQVMPPAAFLSGDVGAFDPQFFSIAPREAVGMDPQQRLLLEVAWEALEDAAEAPERLYESRAGVFVGICANDYAQIQIGSGDTELLNAHLTSGVGHSVASGRISYLLGLQGPSLSVDTACSSSLVATDLACRSLRTNECDLAIAGGVNLILTSDMTVAFMRSGMLAPDGRCKTFADGANGFARGEGCGVVVLKRLADAQRDGNRIYAVIRGFAVNQDGPSSALSAPNGPSQERVIRSALAEGGLEPADIDFIEAHGTGTELGDPIEVRALDAVFGRDRPDDRPLLIGSVKTNFGHLESAAGIAGLIKVALSLDRDFIPAHLHWKKPSRHIPWDDYALRVVADRREWPRGPRPRAAGVSSFGYSGTNCHIVLEEAPRAAPGEAVDTDRLRVLTLSAQSRPALAALAARYAERLRDLQEAAVADLCFTSNTGRSHLAHRLAVLGRSGAELAGRLEAWRGDGWAPGALDGRTPVEPPRLAFAFTGQGSQYVGMGRRLYEVAPVFRRVIDSARGAFETAAGRDLLGVLFGDDQASLQETRFAQPALFVLEIALARFLQHTGLRPAAVFGHSLGEYVAACVAGVFGIDDGIRLTARRGELMQLQTGTGAMLAVAADEASVEAVLGAFRDAASIAAVNGPGAVVVSGRIDAIESIEAKFCDAGTRTKRLEVDRAFHSPLMDPILEAFEVEVRQVDFREPRIRVISSVTGKPLTAAEITSPAYWRRHVREPVRFADAAATFAERGGIVVEVGAHNVLSTFDSETGAVQWIPTLRRDADDAESLLGTLQALYVAGVPIDWRAVNDEPGLRRTALPLYPFQRQHYWVEPRAAGPARALGAPIGHPLLGRRVDSPLEHVQFEASITQAGHAFVTDHRVAGTVIMPGAGFMEAARAAGEAVMGEPVEIDGLELHEAMPVPAHGGRVLQTVVAPTGSGAAAVKLYSRDAAADARWSLHVSGRCRVTSEPAPPADPGRIDAIKARCPAEVDHDSLYRGLAELKLDFGPALHGMRQAWVGRGEVLAEIELPDPLRGEAAAYGVHPALLDACLQSIASTVEGLKGAKPGTLYLPINVGRFRVLGDVPARCFVHARAELAGDDATRLNADLRVYSPQGALVLEATGLQFKSAGGAVLRQLSSRHLEPYLYAVDWQVLEGLGDRQAALDDWVADLPATLAQRADNREIAEYERFFEQFESLCTGYFARTLDELGWNALKQSALADELADALGVVRGHRRLFARMLTVLGEIGTLRKDGERWAAGRLDGPQRLDERLAELEQRYPSAGAEIALVRRCGPALARALRGECDPLELLFPGGAVDDAEGLYRDSPLAVLFNSCIADGIERMSRAGRRLRVLEVGAGTGGTTSHLLERVGDRIDYTFTDVSASFVNRARERFAGFGSVDFKELDLESDPLEQGMPEHGFDVVIASNVLHATRDLGATLNRVKRLLAPRGVLIAFEVLAPHHWFDLTVGMTPGWWAFEDADVRPDYPTISAPAWTALLERVGFVRPGVAVGADDGGVLSRQGIVVAQAPDAESLHEPGDWLILADRGGMGRALAAELEEAGHRCRVVDARELDMSRGDESASSVSALEELIGSRAAPWRGIVHLLALDNARWGSNVAAALEAELGLSCGSALDLAMACAGVEPARAPAVWVVTRGAQRVTGDEFHIEPAQATLWGLGKTVDLEHPALRWRRVDLDPSNPYDQTAELRSIILRGSDERQLAIRDGRLRVPRLRRWKPAKPRSIVEGDAPYELVIGERGSIDALAFRRAERRRPGEGEVEIAVAHTALNFKDVLNVLGLYPGDPGLLGSECAGVVTRVGGAVAGLQPGDRVVAVIGGSFSRFVCAPALQVAKIGDDLPLGRAVTAPIAYLTAEYALAHCGRLGAGDHVLIHAATGGVGMAAVQLARRAGAEIYATAGTAEKRDVLRSLGVRHVYDSRTLAFAEEILRDTGGRGVDVVLNSLADEFVDRSFEVIADGGRFLEIGKRGIWDSKRVSALPKRVEYHVIDWGEVQQREPALIASLFERVIGGLRSGELDPLPARVFPLERVQEAFRCMAQGKHIGKIVVTHPPSSESNDGDRVTAEATYLIAGGLTGLGLRAAQWLVDRGARHLALFGRSAPGVEAESVLAELAERGVEVLVGRADVADRTGLAGFLDDVRGAMPPIRGIVQSTGVLDDAVLLRQNWARFRKVFAPKIIGSQWLHELTAQDSLDFFILFSSLASITGSAGQANHAAANAYLDAFAAARRCDGRPAVSINWGPWSETGAAVRYGVIERGATRGLFPISPSEGLESLELIIGSGAEQVGVANIEWQAYLANQDPVLPFFEALHSKPRTESGTVADRDGEHAGWAEQLERMAPPRQRAEILKFVRAQVTRLLGLAGSDVETDRPLSEMGLDSLLAVEIRNVLGKGFDLTLPATVTFDHPSIDALAAYLFGRKFAEQGAEDPAERGAESASVIDDIETLSDDDIDRLIAERLRAND